MLYEIHIRHRGKTCNMPYSSVFQGRKKGDKKTKKKREMNDLPSNFFLVVTSHHRVLDTDG